SGAYFGDKISPLSDTTNLAPAMAGSDLFEHIHHMLYTTGPAFILSLIGFSLLSFFQKRGTLDQSQIDQTVALIENSFNISIWLFLLPVGVVFLVMKRVPALPALGLGVLGGVLVALVFQWDLIVKMS